MSAASLAPESGSASRLARSAASAAAATITSRILGVVRELVIAAYFGASGMTDAYQVAFRIPNLLRDLFAEGAMSAAFIPTFTRYLTVSGKEPAWRLGNHVINALIVVTGALVVLGIIFAQPLIFAFAADKFTSDPVRLAVTVQMARIMVPTLTLIAVAAAFMGMLNSLHHYFIPSLSPAMFNVMTVVCAFTLVPLMPMLGLQPIVAIAIGTLLGGVAQLALQWPALHKEGFRYHVEIDWRDEGLRRMLTLMGPGAVGMAATQVNVFVNTLLATGTVVGAVSWLNYAFRLMYLPIGLFGVSIGTATLPTVSRQSTERDFVAVRETVTNGLSLMLMLNIPSMVGLIVLAQPIVRLILERGRFTPADTVATAAALQFYAIGLIGYSVVRILSPVFYALGRNRTPVIVSVVAVLVNASLNYLFVRELGYGYEALALGTSLAALFNAAALAYLLRAHLHGLNEARLLGAIVRIAVASVLMGAVAFYANELFTRWLPSRAFIVQALRLSATIGLAVVVLAGSAWLLRIREFNEGVAMVSRRLRRSSR
ncbi:MAG TPA: murein biosynthesis integral membrane protein MurJ [Vicinamibacterales bacterium]